MKRNFPVADQPRLSYQAKHPYGRQNSVKMMDNIGISKSRKIRWKESDERNEQSYREIDVGESMEARGAGCRSRPG